MMGLPMLRGAYFQFSGLLRHSMGSCRKRTEEVSRWILQGVGQGAGQANKILLLPSTDRIR